MSISSSDINFKSAKEYLMKYGYIEDMGDSFSKSENLKKYIIEFQAFSGLNQTSELDEPTIEMMNLPRCGVKDIIGINHSNKQLGENQNHILHVV